MSNFKVLHFKFSGKLYECILEFCDSEIPRENFYGYLEEHIKKIGIVILYKIEVTK